MIQPAWQPETESMNTGAIGSLPPAARSRHRRPPLRMPRGLILAGCLWLIGSWLLVLGLRTPIQASSASFTPNVRVMLVVVTIGLMIGWPLLRLSQRPTLRPMAQTMLDLVVLLLLIQMVIWPLRLVTPWAPARTAALDATLAGWGALAGAVVAAAVGSRRAGPRILAITACLGMCLLGPLAAWLGVVTGVDAMQLVELSPLLAVQTLTAGGGAPPLATQWRWIILLAVAAVLAWIALAAVLAALNQHGPSPSKP